MMREADPLSRAQSILADVVAENDPWRLSECLRGMHLPVISGIDHPAEVIAQAIGLPSAAPEIAFGLAALLGSLLRMEIDRLEIVPKELMAMEVREDPLSPNDEIELFNGLLLACSLPADPSLAHAVQALAPYLEIRGISGVEPRRLAVVLRYAQIYQQVDDALEAHWLQLMVTGSTGTGQLTADQRTVLMDAWRGLLWIPPGREEQPAGEVVSFKRVERGLFRLQDVTEGREGAEWVISRALKIFFASFPRSPEFWQRQLERVALWPGKLCRTAVRHWPGSDKVKQPLLSTSSSSRNSMFWS